MHIAYYTNPACVYRAQLKYISTPLHSESGSVDIYVVALVVVVIVALNPLISFQHKPTNQPTYQSTILQLYSTSCTSSPLVHRTHPARQPEAQAECPETKAGSTVPTLPDTKNNPQPESH